MVNFNPECKNTFSMGTATANSIDSWSKYGGASGFVMSRAVAFGSMITVIGGDGLGNLAIGVIKLVAAAILRGGDVVGGIVKPNIDLGKKLGMTNYTAPQGVQHITKAVTSLLAIPLAVYGLLVPTHTAAAYRGLGLTADSQQKGFIGRMTSKGKNLASACVKKPYNAAKSVGKGTINYVCNNPKKVAAVAVSAIALFVAGKYTETGANVASSISDTVGPWLTSAGTYANSWTPTVVSNFATSVSGFATSVSGIATSVFCSLPVLGRMCAAE